MKFIQAAENNKTEILQFCKNGKIRGRVLEIGSGTGQHIVYFATQMEHVVWQPSEKLGNTASVEERVINANLANLKQTWLLDINCPPDSSRLFDFVYASNVLQCISLNELGLFMLTARKFLKDSGMLVIYGPFLRDGEYASVGDNMLDNHLKINNQEIGIKDLETVKKEARSRKFKFLKTVSMNKNNLILLFTAL